MYRIPVTYTDYNGVERTEDFWFNLSKAELAEMEYGIAGGYSAIVQKIIDSKDFPALIKHFKALVLKAYGVKSDDGRRFMKSEELATEFSQTEAYSEIFMSLAGDDKKAADFVNGIMPDSLRDQLKPTLVPETT